ncbi:MAG: tetratricopeptide repeat protein [Pseudonocardiales bacterium]
MSKKFDVPARYRSAKLRRARKRNFVNQREAISLFERLRREQPLDEPRVLNFFGVGGIGKSRLQHELRELTAQDTDALSARVDLQVPAMRRQDAVLTQLRYCLGAEHGIQLPLFDIAFSAYWQRTNPNVPLSSGELPLVSESEILGDLIEVAGDTPVFGVVVNLVKSLDKLGRKAKRWQRVRHDTDLLDFDRLDAHEMLDALTWFFAKDLLKVLGERSRRAVIFLDAHEALWEDVAARGGRGDRDVWIRDLVAQTPGVLWVISSRDALRWERENASWCEPYLQLCGIGDLQPDDRLAFLADCGIEGTLAQTIASASGGLPFYLNLSVDHWESITEEREPLAEDFGETKEDLLSRFIGHVPRAEEEIFKVLSVARSWDQELFEALVRRFNIAFPLSRWPDFCAYSFNRQSSGDRWLMHQLMRRELLQRLDPQLRVEIHKEIFAFEQARADDPDLPISDRAEALQEALLHGIPAGALDPTWFMRTVEFFMYRGRWKVIAPALEEMEGSMGGSGDPVLTTLRDFAEGWILRQQGQLSEALEVYERLDLSIVAPWEAGIRFQIANSMRVTGDMTGAGLVYAELWERRLADPNSEEIHQLIGIQLADFHYVQGRFRDAQEILHQIVDLDERDHAREIAEAFRILGHIERFNELPSRGIARYRHAGGLFERCEDILGQALIATNIAEASWPVDPVNAIQLASRAIELNSALGASLQVGKAHTAAAYSKLLLGIVSEARYEVENALATLDQVGYRSGIAQARLCRAFVRFAEGDSRGATDDITSAISSFEELAAYPTLRLAGARAARLMGDRSSRPADVRSAALVGLQWLGDAAASEARVEALVERLMRPGQ